MFTQNSMLIESFEHVCQDNFCQGSFTSTERKTVWYGAVSDGCSSSVGSHYGAEFLVKQFARLVPAVYNCGSREQQLLHQIALGLCQSMTTYTPKDAKSGIEECGGIKIYGELAASLQGYVADETNVCLLLAGDGNIGINGAVAKISHGDGVRYPVDFLACPQQEWKGNIGKAFFSVVLSTPKVDSLLLSTDGFEEEEHGKFMNEPAKLIRRIQKEATEPHLSRDPHWHYLGKQCDHRHDDTALVILSRRDTKFKGASASQIVNSIAEKASLYGDISYPVSSKVVIQANDGGSYWNEQTNCLFDPKVAGYTAGVHMFLDGIAVDAVEFNYVPPSGKIAKSAAKQFPALPVDEHDLLGIGKFIPLTRFCDYDQRRKLHFGMYGLGPRHICEILLRLRETLAQMHGRGQYAGNLRPQDIEVRFVRLSLAGAQTLSDPGLKFPNRTYLRAEVKVKPAGTNQLDENFVHPKLWKPIRQMRTNKQAQFDNDCYQFAVLAWWLLSGADPFGEGIPAEDSHNRIYRMANNHYYWNTASKVLIPTDRLQFLKVAQGRWGYNLHADIQQVLNFKTLSFLSAEEMSLIRDHGFRCKNKEGGKPGEGCTLYVHPDTQRCPFCGSKFV